METDEARKFVCADQHVKNCRLVYGETVAPRQNLIGSQLSPLMYAAGFPAFPTPTPTVIEIGEDQFHIQTAKRLFQISRKRSRHEFD
jgi:hypothetical protein